MLAICGGSMSLFLLIQTYPPPEETTNWLDPLQLFSRGMELLPKIIVSVIIFIVGLYLSALISKLLRKTLERRHKNAQATTIISNTTYGFLVLMVVATALQNVGFNLTAFLTGLGIAGFTIGFALQDVSKNFIAGLLLLLQQPFSLGDIIEVNGMRGKVIGIELRATEIKTLDGKQVLIPNADVFTSVIINFTKYPTRRIEINVGVGYETNLDHARQVALEAISSLPGVLPDPAPRIFFGNFGASSIDFTLHYWVDIFQDDLLDLTDQGVLAINTAFKREKIEIPFPVQRLLIQQNS
jgi:small conductance mechanosensitive channel